MSSSLTRMTAFWPPDDPLVLSRMALEGRASRFHCCLANGRLRRTSPIAVRPGEGLLSDHIAGAQRGRRELLFMPLCGHSLRSAATAYDAPLRHSFDAYFGRIIGSHALSFARTMRRRRTPERHDGHWGLAAGARAGAIRAGFPRERDRPARPAGADGRRSERTWRRRDRPSPATAQSDR